MTGRIEMTTYNITMITGTRAGQWMRFSVPREWLARISAENGWRVRGSDERYDLTEAHQIVLLGHKDRVLGHVEITMYP